MQIGVYHIVADNYNKESINNEGRNYLTKLGKLAGITFKKVTLNTACEMDANFIFVKSGGTENLFKKAYDKLSGPYYLLTTGEYNSLAAAIEIATFLKSQNENCEILHGDIEEVANRVKFLATVASCKKQLSGTKFGVIGEPSDWLIASSINEEQLKDKYGIELVHIPMDEFLLEVVTNFASNDKILRELMMKFNDKEVAKVFKVYGALKSLIKKYKLDGLTIRCFDLVEKSSTTACLALALLNKEGYSASCEGDVSSLLSMHIIRCLLDQSSFQANPSNISNDELTLAHCTVPFDMCNKYTFMTHFETNQGIAVKGNIPEGDVTIFKLAADLKSYVAYETTLIENLNEKNLCRTQIKIKIDEEFKKYLLTNPCGNHHIVVKGHCKALLDAFLNL